MTWFHLRTFYAEEGGERRHASKPDEYVGWFRELLNRLVELTPERLGRRIDLWPDPDPPIFDQLRLYVWSKQELFSGDETAGRILALSDDRSGGASIGENCCSYCVAGGPISRPRVRTSSAAASCVARLGATVKTKRNVRLFAVR